MLEVKGLRSKFKVGANEITAVDNVSLSVKTKQMVGIVGESGSGKSVTALSIMNLMANNGWVDSGEILWNSENLCGRSEREWREIRGKEMALIFQNPLAALNPVFSVGQQLCETIMLHRKVSCTEAESIAVDYLRKVNIPDPKTRLNDYPHQFSIGMCQRIMIALSLSMQPKLLIADEPTASLDVTIQAQILHLLNELKESMSLSILMISHDLGIIAQHCDYVYIMYLGRIIEEGFPVDIFKNPKHPYTQALISAIPDPDPTKKSVPTLLSGELPSPMNIPSGCRFHTRCPKAMPECTHTQPLRVNVNDHHSVECLLYPE
jgi:oligopeptide/dipeptide ABC transporter ATP-binding protein